MIKLADGEMNIGQAPARSGGIRAASEQDLALINARSPEPLSVDQVYVLESTVSTDALNSYFLRMADSSLANYVEDALAGNPLMTGHDLGRLPIGKSFDARIEEVDSLKRVVVRDYLLRGHSVDGNNTDEVARAVRGGIATDISISFGGPDCWYRCGICGKDIWDDDCPHVPGIDYGDGRAFAWVENARMFEHSIVFDGADPGAVINKALRYAAEGRLSRADIRFLEDTFRLSLADNRQIIAPDKPAVLEEKHMNGRELVARLRSALTDDMRKLFGGKLDAISVQLADDAPIEMALSQIADACREVTASAADVALAGYRELGINSIDELEQLAEKAKLGDAYRNDLIEQTLSAGVRGQGENFDKERWTRTLAASSIEDVKAFKEEFDKLATQRLGTGGRQTTAPDPNAAPTALAGDFDNLPRADQDERVKAFLSRTGVI